MTSLDVDNYLRQWLHTAGVFDLNFAWQTDRIQVRCKCGAILRLNTPTSEEMPWVLQDWVSTHGHNGNHGVEVKSFSKPIMKVMLAPVSVTADFKPVKPVTARIAKGRRFR